MNNTKLFSLTTVLLLLLAAGPMVSARPDDSKVPLKEAISAVEASYGVNFFYSNNLPGLDSRAAPPVHGESLEAVLEQLFSGLPISWTVTSDRQVLLKPSAARGKTQGIVRGRVYDSSNLPVIGAGVVGPDGKGVITDLDGRFEIEVNGSDVELTVSSLGYLPSVIRTAGKTSVEVLLREDRQQLEESVVVGYGVQKKVNLTGAVSMMTAEDVASRPLVNMSTGLQGLLPGVTVISPSGQPGESMSSIRIRGIGTIGTADPLILIDGVEGDLSTINPEDVESISVLKDAASAAIYGARAANGVLLVTTRSLEKQKEVQPKISFGSYYGFQSPTRLPEMCNAIEFMTLDNEARLNVGTPAAWTETEFEKVRTGSAPNYFADTDWVNTVMRKSAPQKSVNLSVNGNVGGSGYMVTYRYLDQEGLTAGSTTGEKRHNFRVKLNTKLLDRVTLGTNVSYTNNTVTSPLNSLTSGGGAIYTAMRIAPNAPVRYTDGSWAYGGGNTNPMATLVDGGGRTTSGEVLNLHNTMKVDILKGWDVTATYNITSTNKFVNTLKKTITFVNPETGDTEVRQSPNSLKNKDIRGMQQSLILQSNFNFSISDHHIGGVAGFSQEWSEMSSFEASRSNLINEIDPTLNLGDASTMGNASGYQSWAIRSGFGRLTYDWNERYLLEMNLRYDLSSRFHPSHRGGLFPSFSGAWRISEENWMKPTRDLIDNLKIRASWGMLGNQYVGSSNYPYLSILSLYTDDLSLIGANPTTGYVQSTLANPNLTWERIKMLDVGFDLMMLDGRFNFSFDWYDKNTEGILLQLNYPAQIGAKPSEENAGKVNNRGWEFDLGWKDQIGDFFYSVNFNLSDVKNKIVDLGPSRPDLTGDQVRIVGYPIDSFYGYIAEGLMMPEDFKISDIENNNFSLPKVPVVLGNDYQPGDIKYKDISGPDGVPDGRITPEYDKAIIGSPIPRYTYCARIDLGWKNFDFSAVVQGVGKCDGYLTGTARHALMDMAAYPQKCHLERFNISTNPNPNASYPRLTYNKSFNQNTFSTYWLEDASYMRLKNVQIGYTLPKKIADIVRMDKARVYVSADNMLTLTKFFSSYDPETPVSKGGYYPQIKTIVFGIDITFK